MGYDLYRDTDDNGVGGYFRFSIWGFPPIRFLAEAYGWEPMGAIYYDEEGNEEEERMGYDTNDGQTVCAEDANNWADALELVLKDNIVPEIDEYPDGRKIDDDYMKERALIWTGDTIACAKYWSGESKYIQEFIDFLREGEFVIW